MVWLTKKILNCIFMVPVLFTFLSCSGNPEERNNPNPLWLAMVPDFSDSVEKINLQTLSNDHLDRLIDAIQRRGGGMAFGMIDEGAFKPLDRVDLVPVIGRLDERAMKNQSNRRGVDLFISTVQKKLDRPRDADRSDVRGAIARLALFFSEPIIPPGAEKIALFLSDGIDTGPMRKKDNIHLPPDVKVYVVGMEKGAAERLFGPDVILFESVDAAIEMIKRTGRRGNAT